MAATSTPVGLLLAAGRGMRFDAIGRASKLLAAAPAGPQAGTPVALAAARTLRSVLPRVVAVVRRADSPLQQQLHAALLGAGCELAINERADDGMASSIAVGVAAAADACGWLVALADMPAVAPATIAAVRDAIAAGALTAAPTHARRRGHPVGFGHSLHAELLALAGDAGARAILDAHPPTLISTDDPGCLLDLDTMTDFEQARSTSQQRAAPHRPDLP